MYNVILDLSDYIYVSCLVIRVNCKAVFYCVIFLEADSEPKRVAVMDNGYLP